MSGGQHEYLVVKAHIDDLMRAAERARMTRGVVSRTQAGAARRLLARLRHLIGRCPDVTTPELHAGCP